MAKTMGAKGVVSLLFLVMTSGVVALRLSPLASMLQERLAAAGPHALALSTAALLAVSPPGAVLAEDGALCTADCFRECNALAPGNEGYCTAQCDTYCESLGPNGYDPSKRDTTQSDKEDERALAERNKLLVNNGIAGDLGAVKTSSGVEDLLAAAFGAKRQSKDVNKADIGEYASELTATAAKVVLGGQKAQ